MSRTTQSSRLKVPTRFQPSRRDIDFYRALTSSNRPLSIQELIVITGAERSTVDHTMRFYFERGVVNRVFLEKAAFFSWAPKPEGKTIAKAIADAAAIAVAIPKNAASTQIAPVSSKPRGNPDAQALRAIAALLMLMADRLDDGK